MDVINSSDEELIEKLRIDNNERFVSLAKMHLSFELDLNMDELDAQSHEIMYYYKGKLTKLNRLTKKIKSCTSGKILSPAEDNSIHLTKELIQQLRKLKEFLMDEENIKHQGIFRLTGAISRQNELRKLIVSYQTFDLTTKNEYTVNDCATVFKNILSNLPEPVLTDSYYIAYCQIAEICNNSDVNVLHAKELNILSAIQILLLLIPDENRILFMDIIEMLSKTIKYKKYNKMTAESLATLFAPHLICPRNLPAEALYDISQNMLKVIVFMITKGLQIFKAPAKLITDIRAYFIEQNRTLDESISDLSTVNTVYTFVDREKTAAANNSDATDTALAQLYAHIQSLPESSKKRKLIRQFNKENGQGTPLQFLMMNRLKNEGSATRKSISDSIKKHIFHKSLISRTPKRSTNNSLLNLGTPNAATKSTKSRVLFQSPICNSNLSINASSLSSTSIKKHNLHKSISSSSLLLKTPSTPTTSATLTVKTTLNQSSSEKKTTVSTKSSTITSSNQNLKESPLPITSSSSLTTSTSTSLSPPSAIEQTTNNTDNDKENSTTNKSIEQDNESNSFDSDSKIIQKLSNSNMKHKSEPNLNRIHYENDAFITDNSSSQLQNSSSLTRRNNSMMNMKFEYKQIKNRQIHDHFLSSSEDSINEVIDSPIFKIDYGNQISSHVYCNKNLVTSTPSVFLDRKSMSPITKSTQRMPKSMQESIMTPRSRKPVMLTTTLGSSEQNQTISSLREEDEDSILMKNQNEYHPNYQSSITMKDDNNIMKTSNQDENMLMVSDSLTNTFREYLLSRKVVTTSPEDSSFSSHSDDFGSTPDICNFSERDLSESLLYCLNGNNPVDNLSSSSSVISSLSLSKDCDSEKIVGIGDMISRKRSISQNDNNDENKENYDDNNMKNVKKLCIVEESSL